MLLFCNVDENGNIILALMGQNIIPDRQYDYFFYLTEEINPMNYRVIGRQLVEVEVVQDGD